MAQKKNNTTKPQHQEPLANVRNQQKSSSLFEWFEKILESNRKLIAIIIVGLAALFSIITFDAKISTGFDDSMYIESGYHYYKNFFGFWHSSNAPLYPLFLSLPIALSGGINVVFLKFFSVLFFVAGIYFLYKAFVNKIPYLILFPVLFLVATNSLFLVHASLTYTEAFFSFIQALFFFVLFKLTTSIDSQENNNFGAYKNWILIGLMLLIMYLSRSVGLGAVIVMFIYFLFQKNWKASLASIVAFAVFALPFEGIKRTIWKNSNQFSNQGNAIFQKDYYDAGKGMETFGGFFKRFWDNAQIYLSSKTWEMLGFRADDSLAGQGLTVFTILLALTGLFFAIRNKQKGVLLAGLYFFIISGITFLVLHTNWGQGRLIMIVLPFFLMSAFYGIYSIANTKSTSVIQPAYLILLLVFFGANLGKTFKLVKTNLPFLSESLGGNKYAGYTPDWTNYLKISEWSSKNLPDSAYVACRKNSMSFIYGNGKAFYPIFKTNSTDADTLLNTLKDNKVTHIILAELRMDPRMRAEGNFVNTIHRYMSPIEQKYPGTFTLEHQEGNLEKAQLFKINYDVADKIRQTGGTIVVPNAPPPPAQK